MSGVGERHAVAIAIQQAEAEFVFQVADLGTQGRLRAGLNCTAARLKLSRSATATK